jgi:hypothetical protein
MLHAWSCQHILLETASMEGQTVKGHGHALQNTLKGPKNYATSIPAFMPKL